MNVFGFMVLAEVIVALVLETGGAWWAYGQASGVGGGAFKHHQHSLWFGGG